MNEERNERKRGTRKKKEEREEKIERRKKRYRWTESLKDRNDRTEVEIDRGRE